MNFKSEKFKKLIEYKSGYTWTKEQEEYLEKLYSQLNTNGIIVGRKLLGNYEWKNLQETLENSKIYYLQDKTDFYSECVMIRKM